MKIIFSEEAKQFHIYNSNISYIFRIMENEQLEHLYYGSKLNHKDDFSSMVYREKFATSSCAVEGNLKFSLDYAKAEFSSAGTGDYKRNSHTIVQEDGSKVTEFKYSTYNILDEKPSITDMPSTFADKGQSLTLEIILIDEYADLEMKLYYTIFEDQNIITKYNKLINHGDKKIRLQSALSGIVDFKDCNYEMLHLSGEWARERHVIKKKLSHGVASIGSTRGSSSHQHNPFIAIAEDRVDEFTGKIYGFSLVYSGDFIAEAEVDHNNQTRISMGIHPENFEFVLEKEEDFETPELIMAYSDSGLNKLSQSFHRLFLDHLMNPRFSHNVTPILCNNWEGTFFDFDEEKLLNIAKRTKELGMEMFVLDDGWFGKRDDDKSSLGDWFVYKDKLPSGIDGLSRKVEELGIKFGLWFEPEMANLESELYKKHPDYIVKTPNRKCSHGRNQYVLDFSRKEVVENIFEQMAQVIDSSKISYIKWDMNRYITEPYSLGLSSEKQGEFMHRYILGVYKLYDMLIQRFPDILFESCASGGGRFDPALLYYAPQCWASDDTDAMERIKIQYGTSIVYPLRSIGSHVTKSPNHNTLRDTPLQTRANVAYFGTFGYELDITENSADDDVVKEQIEFFKEHRELIQFGDFYRITSPFDGNVTSWMVVSKDKKEAIAGVYLNLLEPNRKKINVKFVGLDENTKYRVEGNKYYGDELMEYGFTSSTGYTGSNKLDEEALKKGSLGVRDFTSTVYHIKAL